MSTKFGKVHSRKHTITSSNDHSADPNKLLATDAAVNIIELPNGALNAVLTSTGPTTPPSWQLTPASVVQTSSYNTDHTI